MNYLSSFLIRTVFFYKIFTTLHKIYNYQNKNCFARLKINPKRIFAFCTPVAHKYVL